MRRWLCALSLLLVASATHAAGAQTSADKEFLQKSAQGDVNEVELAKLALKKSSNQEIRSIARRMIADHEALEARIKARMDKAGVPVPGSLDTEHQKEFDTLNGLSGDEFDREYVKSADQDHHKDLEAFNKEIASTKDSSLKSVLQTGQPVIAKHTRMLDALSAKMNLAPPGQTERQAGRVIR